MEFKKDKMVKIDGYSRGNFGPSKGYGKMLKESNQRDHIVIYFDNDKNKWFVYWKWNLVEPELHILREEKLKRILNDKN